MARRRKFSDEYKREAVRLATEPGVTKSQVGRELGINANMLGRWYPLLDSLEMPRSGFHRLRHTFASIALQAGGDIGTVSKLLGHASMNITLAVYGHFIPGLERETVEAFEAAIEASKMAH
jgi:integrase